MALNGVKFFGDNGVLVTGINTASGVTDQTGVWNEDINIQTILASAGHTLPAEASAVVLRIQNLKSINRWGGVRTAGETIAELQRDFTPSDEDNFVVVPFNGTNFLLDFYTEEIGATPIIFTVIASFQGYVNFPISTRPTQATTANAVSIRTISTAGAGSTIIANYGTTGGKWCPTAETVTQTNVILGQFMAKLDASKQLKLQSTTTLTINGYWPDGMATWPATWLSLTMTPTADSAWHDSPFTFVGKKAVFGYVDKSATSRYDLRRKGSTRAVSLGATSSRKTFFTELNTNGESEYNYLTGATGNFVYQASFDEFTGAVTTLLAPDEIEPNTTVTLVPENFSGALTSATLTDALGNSITLSVTANEINIPAIGETADSIQFGVVTVEGTDGTDVASDETDYVVDAGFALTTVASPVDDGHSLYSLLLAEGKTVVNGDQFYYPTAFATTVAPDTIVTTNADDFILYLIETTGESWEINYFSGDEPSLTIIRSGVRIGIGIGIGI